MGLMMARNGSLRASIWVGLGLFCLGYGSLLTLGRSNPSWEYVVYLLPAGFGQGLAMPSLLFSAIRMAEPGGSLLLSSILERLELMLTRDDRARSGHLGHLLDQIGRRSMGRSAYIGNNSKHGRELASRSAPRCCRI